MPRSCLARLLLGTCLILPTASVWAQSLKEPRPWYLGASASLTQVSNVYRVNQLPSQGQEVSNDDRVTGATVYGGIHARLGRQRLRLDGSLINNSYQRNPGLRYQGYNAKGGVDWQLGNDLSGTLELTGQRGLAPFNPGTLPSTFSKNMETNRGASLGARYGLFGPWSIDVGLSSSRRDYSLALYDRWDLELQSFDVGLRWSPSPALSTRLVVRNGRGKYPRVPILSATQGGGFQEDKFKRKDLDLILNWQPNSLHTVAARLGQGRTTHELATASNGKGTNYRLDWTWLPSNKLRLQTILARENGADTQQLRFAGFVVGDALNARRYDTLQLQGAYALTTKLSLTAAVAEIRRTVDSSLNGNTTSGGRDKTQTGSLGLNWAITRNASALCQVNTDRRKGTALFGQPYSSHSVGCTLRYGIEG